MPTPDEAGFTAFVRTHQRALERAAWLLTHDRHAAEDLVQTALLGTARQWPRIHTDAYAYTRRSLYHAAVSGWRRRRVREQPIGAHDAAAPQPDQSLAMTLTVALEQLTPKQRAVVVLRHYEDLTEVQTSEVLGIRPGTVKSVNRQAMARLRQLLPDLATELGLPALAHPAVPKESR